jgi:hypothetical protein
MNMLKISILMICLSISTIANSFGNWSSTEIVAVTTYSDERAAIRINNYTNPNPSSAVWDCTGGVMYIGTVSGPAPKGMLSTVLSAHATKKPIRFGVYGSDTQCYINYITIVE